MDLRKEWQQLHQEKFNYSPINKEQIMKAIYQESTSTIAQLKTRLGYKLAWIIFFTAVFGIWILFSLNRPELLMILGVMIIYYISGLIGIGIHYRKMQAGNDFSVQTLPLLKAQDRIMRNALNFEKIWGLVFFPLATLAGLLIGNHFKGVKFADLYQDPKFLTTALICVIILVPFAYWLSNKLNQSGFGQLMENLQNNIRRMEDLA